MSTAKTRAFLAQLDADEAIEALKNVPKDHKLCKPRRVKRTFSIDEFNDAKMYEEAKLRGISVSAYIRLCIKHYENEHCKGLHDRDTARVAGYKTRPLKYSTPKPDAKEVEATYERLTAKKAKRKPAAKKPKATPAPEPVKEPVKEQVKLAETVDDGIDRTGWVKWGNGKTEAKAPYPAEPPQKWCKYIHSTYSNQWRQERIPTVYGDAQWRERFLLEYDLVGVEDAELLELASYDILSKPGLFFKKKLDSIEARLKRAFTPLSTRRADAALWCNIDLNLSAAYPDLEYVSPYTSSGTELDAEGNVVIQEKKVSKTP